MTSPAAAGATPPSDPVVAETVVAETAEQLAAARAQLGPGTTAVVMTMGALHEGHATLLRTAAQGADHLILTIFVNPLQFGANEDLARYPRTFEADLAIAAQEGVDLVFAPTPEVIYPEGEPGVRIVAGPLGERLEGASRPGHFDGVLTVVGKLLHLTSADCAYFGQKDAQQLLLIKRMVADLNFPVEIVAVPTVREEGGLARSSRNVYLSESERSIALTLSRALSEGAAAAEQGPSAVETAARAVLAGEPGLTLDYLALVHPSTLDPLPEEYRGEALLALAAKVGSTRLIDNLPVVLGPGGGAIATFS